MNHPASITRYGWRFNFHTGRPTPQPLYYNDYQTPFGFVVCVTTASTLVNFLITDHRSTNRLLVEMATLFGNQPTQNPAIVDPYFEKALKPNKKVLGVDLYGTPFQLSVWRALLDIPEGQTRSYVDVANMLHKPQAMRAVGGAVGKNPICYIVPCHRVIRHDGSIGGYGGGLNAKRLLLAHEGLPQFLK